MSNSALIRIDIRAMIEAMNGEILPSIYSNESYSGDVYIRPSNVGTARISIALPTIYTKKIYPTKDSYTDSNNPVLNFGKAQPLIVNSNRYAAYMSFSLKDLPANSVIESANFNIFKQNYTNQNSIDLYRTTDDYFEIGLTYLNAPSIGEKLFTQQLDNVSGYSTKDVSSGVIDWYTNSKLVDRAYTISSVNSEPVIFTSKEGIDAPYIEVNYYIDNQNVGINEVYGEIYPICIRNKEFNGEIFVESGTRNLYSPGEINIINQNRQISYGGEINIQCSQNINYNGEIYVPVHDGLISSVLNDILPSVRSNTKYAGEINVINENRQIEYNADIIVQRTSSLGHHDEINIITQNSKSEFSGEILVQLNDSLDYNGKINIINQNNQSEFSGEILVEYNSSLNYNGEINIPPESREVPYAGEILVQYNKSLTFNGNINIITQNSKSEFSGEILVQYNKSLTFNGNTNIITQNSKSEFSSETDIKTISNSMTIGIGEIEPAVLTYKTIDGEINLNNSDSAIIAFSGEIDIAPKATTTGYVFIL